LIALSAVLGESDYNLVLASSGAEALHHLRERDFAVVLMDVMMPGMDGFECATKIRESARWTSVPIIFVTAVAAELDFVFKGYRSGAVDYIVKPIVPAIVKAKVSIFAELFRARELLKVQLTEARALCQKLSEESAERQERYDVIVEHVRRFTSAFEARLVSDETKPKSNLTEVR
jgi:DNA-binding response OmpR family regulator